MHLCSIFSVEFLVFNLSVRICGLEVQQIDHLTNQTLKSDYLLVDKTGLDKPRIDEMVVDEPRR